MTYPWAIVLAAFAIAIGAANMKLVPDPVKPETACAQQRGRWTIVWHSQHWYSNWYFTCEFKEAHQP